VTPFAADPPGAGVRFSVVIPCHDAEPYVAETLDRALRQGHPPHEVIAIDDASTDGTLALLRDRARGDGRIRVLSTPAPSGGPSLPRNLGIAAAEGEYVALLDADDLWGEDKLANDARFLERHRPDILYSGAFTFVGTPDRVTRVQRARRIDWRFEIKNHVPTSSICIRKDYCDGLERPVFDPDPLLKFEDYHFLLRAYFGGASIVAREGIDTYYRFRPEGSRVSWADLGESLRRQFYNIAKLGVLHRLTPARCGWMMLGHTGRIGRQAIRRRLTSIAKAGPRT